MSVIDATWPRLAFDNSGVRKIMGCGSFSKMINILGNQEAFNNLES